MENLSNNAVTVWASSVSAGATTGTVSTGLGVLFPSSGSFRVISDSEIIAGCTLSGDVIFFNGGRGSEGTSAASHAAGANVACVVTAAGLLQYAARLSPEVTFANRPTSPPVGAVANISDSNTNTFGATVAGSGSNHVLARWNGTNWTVCGV